jgi:hypothetical protein
MCPGLDSNQHGCPPPPQDGASTNFATWAFAAKVGFFMIIQIKVGKLRG